MKILISTDAYEYQTSGVTNSILVLKDELKKRGHDVRILALSPKNISFFKDNVYYIASKPISIYPGARFSFKTHDNLINEIIKWHPDLVHIQTEFSSRILANKIIKTLNIPFVITCHAMYEDYTKYFCPSKKLGRLIIKRCSNKYYNPSKALIVPSNKLKIKEQEYRVKCPIEVIPSGIDLAKYQKKLTAKERGELLSKLNLSDSNKCLVSISRLAAEKNIDEILNYLPDLIAEDQKIKLIIVGDGPYKSKLIKTVKKLNLQNHVIFTGMVPSNQVYKYYQLGDIFVCASTSESQGLTYIEALASGLPLVCKKDKCLEGVLENGKNGFIFETKQDFIKGILSIINNQTLLTKMSKNSLQKSTNYSKEIFGQIIENLYKKVL